ncbi:MAG: BON domain-containing protein [Planctomycetales bacterium]|nr:BON domain-containing protein [Planctomycetales bacterium]
MNRHPSFDPHTSDRTLRTDSADETVSHRLRTRFHECPYTALRALDCTVTDGVAKLRGKVPSFYMKQIAQVLAGRVDGIVGVENQIEVHQTAPEP